MSGGTTGQLELENAQRYLGIKPLLLCPSVYEWKTRSACRMPGGKRRMVELELDFKNVRTDSLCTEIGVESAPTYGYA